MWLRGDVKMIWRHGSMPAPPLQEWTTTRTSRVSHLVDRGRSHLSIEYVLRRAHLKRWFNDIINTRLPVLWVISWHSRLPWASAVTSKVCDCVCVSLGVCKQIWADPNKMKCEVTGADFILIPQPQVLRRLAVRSSHNRQSTGFSKTFSRSKSLILSFAYRRVGRGISGIFCRNNFESGDKCNRRGPNSQSTPGERYQWSTYFWRSIHCVSVGVGEVTHSTLVRTQNVAW